MKRVFITLGTVLVLTVVCIIAIQSTSTMLASRHSFDGLISKLESKEIAPGASVKVLWNPALGKSVTEVYREDEQGVRYGVSAYMHDHETLLIYWHDEEIYAACRLIGIRTSAEKWYFCDHDLLVHHIDLAQANE